MIVELFQNVTFCENIFFGMSLGILLFSLAFAIFLAIKKLNIAKPLSILGIAFVLSDCLLLFFLLFNSGNSGDKPITIAQALSSSVMGTAQLITLDIDYGSLIAAANGKVLFLLTVSCILTPIVWGSFLLSLFETFSSWIAYQIFHFFVPVYIFSELNENSLVLAENIKSSKSNRCLCVFCDVGENVSSELKEKVKETGCLLFKKSELNYFKSPAFSQSFFEISENQDENLSHAKDFILKYTEKYKDQDYSLVKVFLFSEQEETPFVLSSIDKKCLPVILINRNRFIVNDLFFKYPLYKAINKSDKTLSLLILGAGKVGQEILKTAVWCSQIGKDYKLKFTVLDKDADRAEQRLRLDCPELFCGEYDISFIHSDVACIDFIEKIKSHSPEANYICVCLGNDELNIQTAFQLTIYAHRNSSKKTFPFIAVQVKDVSKNTIISENTKLFKVFGGNNLIYSTAIINSELENLALNIQQIYMNGESDKKKVFREYYKDEYNVKACRANALHIKYKLFSLGYSMVPLEKGKENKFLKEKVFSEENVQTLTKIEHDRWNAYTRSEGWCRASLKQISDAGCNSTKIKDAKLHACLCSWEELDEVSKYFNVDYKKFDRDFVENIPRILGMVKDYKTVSDVRYLIEKAE